MTIRVRNLGLNVMALVGLSLAYPAISRDAGDGQVKTAAQNLRGRQAGNSAGKGFPRPRRFHFWVCDFEH